MSKRKICRWCIVEIREREVLVGRAPGRRAVPMLIDIEPHEDGSVIERDDGCFRLLMPEDRRDPNKPRYRIHGRKTCAPQEARR
jgi:hypothetical protein